MQKADDPSRFWGRVDQSGGPEACWPFVGCINEYGFGWQRFSGRNWIASRLAWALSSPRPAPQGISVLHSCANRRCCNPAHLFLGRSMPPKSMTGERFLSRIAADVGGCWNWLGNTYPDGYGQVRHDGRCMGAHRWSFSHFVGPIPAHLEVDHICRNRACVRPDHLQLLSHGENCRRARLGWTKRACIRGHRLAGDNLELDSKGRRVCRECKGIRYQMKLARKRDRNRLRRAA